VRHFSCNELDKLEKRQESYLGSTHYIKTAKGFIRELFLIFEELKINDGVEVQLELSDEETGSAIINSILVFSRVRQKRLYIFSENFRSILKKDIKNKIQSKLLEAESGDRILLNCPFTIREYTNNQLRMDIKTELVIEKVSLPRTIYSLWKPDHEIF
jgi:hypothetical protein